MLIKISEIAELEDKKFKTKVGELSLLKKLGKGKSGYSYLTKYHDEYFVLKKMHDEPCSYYSFSDNNKVELEIEAYQKINNCNILIPKLICYDFEKGYLVKEFIEGITASEMIANDQIPDLVFRQLFNMYHKVKSADMNIDYFPTNFIVSDQQLFYIDYECNSYKPEWNLPNWGLYYWANSEGFKDYLSTGDSTFINESLEKGIPIKKPFEEKVSRWIRKYDVK